MSKLVPARPKAVVRKVWFSLGDEKSDFTWVVRTTSGVEAT
jgi:hypothetical protein